MERHPRFDSLADWLGWQEQLHWSAIDMGLERITLVAEKMDLLHPAFKIITVAGTNGKGSTVAMLDAMLGAEGYVTGCCTSPHISRYNERITLAGREFDDQSICEAFDAIDRAREEISLTYFEFGVLAAIWLFHRREVDVALLEVGMGGRLDAVNAWNADLAIITNIGLDHVQWLGEDREAIGREKAGIMRRGKPAVCGDLAAPASIAMHARESGAQLIQAGVDYSWRRNRDSWSFQDEQGELRDLPLPALRGEFQINNAANVLAGLRAVSTLLPLGGNAIHTGLGNVKLAGRLEIIRHRPLIILDVAHNGHAARQLRDWLLQQPVCGKTFAIFSILEGKDVREVIEIMHNVINRWFIFSLQGEYRGLDHENLDKYFRQADSRPDFSSFDSIEDAWQACCTELDDNDRVVVFGSFHVISKFKVIF